MRWENICNNTTGAVFKNSTGSINFISDCADSDNSDFGGTENFVDAEHEDGSSYDTLNISKDIAT